MPILATQDNFFAENSAELKDLIKSEDVTTSSTASALLDFFEMNQAVLKMKSLARELAAQLAALARLAAQKDPTKNIR